MSLRRDLRVLSLLLVGSLSLFMFVAVHAVSAAASTNPPIFTITANPDPLIIPQGREGEVNISVNESGNFTGPVNLSDHFPQGPDYPAGVGSLNGTSGSVNFSVAWSISTDHSTPLGNYSVSIIGTGSNLTRILTLPIIVVSPVQSYYLTPYTNTSYALAVGNQENITITAHSILGFTGTVNIWYYPVYHLSASITPSSVTLQPDGTASVTLTISADTPGNYSLLVLAETQNITFNQQIYLNINAEQPIGLLAYGVFSIGTPILGGTVQLVNAFANIGNLPISITYGSITIDSAPTLFTFTPNLILQPGQSASYNLTITIPQTTHTGNETVTATLKWAAEFNNSWTTAPPLVIHGHLIIQSPPPVPKPSGNSQPTMSQVVATTITTLAENLGIPGPIFWLTAAAIYIPTMILFTSLILNARRHRNTPPKI